MFLLYLIVALCLMRCCRRQWQHPTAEFHDFDLAATLPLRGLLALLIVCHHLSLNPITCATWLGQQLVGWGSMLVGLFYFISGYGLMTSYLARGDRYLEGFTGRQARKLFIPLILPAIVYQALNRTIGIEDVSLQASIYAGNVLSPCTWFAYVQMLFYMAFYASARCVGPRHVLWVMWVLLILYVVAMAASPFCDCWYQSAPALGIGMTYRRHEARLKGWLSAHRSLGLGLLLAFALAAVVLALAADDGIANKGLKAISLVMLPLIMVASVYWTPLRSAWLDWTGRISYHIYIIHGILIMLLPFWPWNIWASLLACIVASVLVAYGHHWLLRRLSLG